MLIRFDGVTESVQPDPCRTVPKGHIHRLKNTGDEGPAFFAARPKQ